MAALLFLIPGALLLIGAKPAPFGFQMFSGYGEVSAEWLNSGGQATSVDLSEHLASPRHEIDWLQHLPEHLCADIPEAHTVEVRRTTRGGDQIRRLTCQR